MPNPCYRTRQPQQYFNHSCIGNFIKTHTNNLGNPWNTTLKIPWWLQAQMVLSLCVGVLDMISSDMNRVMIHTPMCFRGWWGKCSDDVWTPWKCLGLRIHTPHDLMGGWGRYSDNVFPSTLTKLFWSEIHIPLGLSRWWGQCSDNVSPPWQICPGVWNHSPLGLRGVGC